MEVVLPIEVEIPSLRVIMETKLSEAEWVQKRFEKLNFIKEKRMKALCLGQLYLKRMTALCDCQLYQKRMKKSFDKKVKPREFREGDPVLRKIMSFNADSSGK